MFTREQADGGKERGRKIKIEGLTPNKERNNGNIDQEGGKWKKVV